MSQDKLQKILKDNPGATLLLDNDCFWVVRDMDAGNAEDLAWDEVPGNELYEGHQPPEHELLLALAAALNLKVERV